jgi:hypothetical protein
MVPADLSDPPGAAPPGGAAGDVKQCRLRTLSDRMRRCDLFGLPEEAARQRLRAFIETRGAPDIEPFPGKVVAASNIDFGLQDP